MNRSLKAAKLLAAVVVAISTTALFTSFGRYIHVARTADVVSAIAPLERDYVAQSVEPYVKDRPGGDSVLDMVKGSHEEARTLHEGWASFAEHTKSLFLIQLCLWGSSLIASVGVVVAIQRASRNAQSSN